MKSSQRRPWVHYVDELIDWEAVWKAGERSYGDLATWWVQATPGVNYYRAEMPAKHLPGKWVKLEERDLRQVGRDEFFFTRQSGTAVWMFPGNDSKAVLMAEMRMQGTRVLVEVDDNYCIPPPDPVAREWSSTRVKAGPPSYASYQTHRWICESRAVDGFVVSTPYLGKVYERFGKDIYVCPNSIDPEDWEPPFYGGNVELEPIVRSGNLRIGWAGSVSHKYDLPDIRQALDWASRQKGVEVVVLGQLHPGVECWQIPWTDTLAEYRRNVHALDVILCPLRPSKWSDCKSDVKALEGSMGGAVPVVSRTEPFRPWWDRTYVADTPKDFLKIVKHLVAHPDEAREMAEVSRHYALHERSIERSIDTWRNAVGTPALVG